MTNLNGRLNRISSERRHYILTAMPYHLAAARMWDKVEDLLTDLVFIEAKCRAGLADDLSDDYQRALAVLPASTGRDRVTAFQDALTRVYSSVAAYPEWAFNHLLWAVEQELPDHDLTRPATRGQPWLRVPRSPLDLTSREVEVHVAAIASLATSGDGRIAVSASERGSVKVWDVLTSRPLCSLYEDRFDAPVLLLDHQIPRVAISGGGTYALTVVPFRGLFHSRISGGGATTQIFAERAVRLLGAILSEDGLLTVLGPAGEGDTYAVWDCVSGTRLDVPLLPLPAPQRAPVLAADAALSRIVSADGGDICWIWDRSPRAPGLSAAPGHDRVLWAALSRDGRVLVTADSARVVRLFVNAGRQWRPRVLGKHSDQVGGVCVARDGRWAASCGHDGFLRIWSTQPDGWQWETQVILDDDTRLLEAIAVGPGNHCVIVGGHDGISRVIPFDPSQPGKRTTPAGRVTDVASVARDGSTVLTIDMASQGQLEVTSPATTSLAFEARSRKAAVSADGKHAVWVSGDKEVCLASLVDGSWCTETLAVRGLLGESQINAVELAEDGSLLVLGFELNPDGLALCCVRTDPGRDLQATPDTVHLAADYQSARALAISASRRWIALGSLRRKSGVWDRRARRFHPGPAFDDYVSAATIVDRDAGFHAAFADASGSVRLYPGPGGTAIVCPSLARNRVLGLAFGCAGRALAAVSADRWLQVFDGSSGRLLTAFRIPGALILCCAWDDMMGQIAVGQAGVGALGQWVFEVHDLFLPSREG